MADGRPAELTVIFVSYNTRALTLKAIETVRAETSDTAIDIAVWDNASHDGSADAIAEAFPDVRLFRSPDNLGFAAGNNEVAKHVETEWLLLLNTDTETHEGAVDRLLAFAKARPQAGIYGGRTVYPDGSLNAASCWNRITPWSAFCSATGLTAVFKGSPLFDTEAIGGWARDSVREVDIVVGCFLLIRRALWEELGGFDTRYWMYGEEADLCLRARARGYRPAITPDAVIMHLVGQSTTKNRRAERRALVAKARSTLIRTHWPAALRPFGLAMMWLWGAGRRYGSGALATLLPREVFRERAALWRAVWQARADWLAGY
ncbi:MAG: glycosyltransferase family 2 protein [Pseudomonadota bacterium]